MELWDTFEKAIDTRIMGICRVYQLSMWYAEPCLIDHAIVHSAYGTPTARAPDFDPEFRLSIGDGFQPPEEIPGKLTPDEGKLLWNSSLNRTVLEIGRGSGRATVCLAQQARRVVSMGRGDPAEAIEWIRRYGLSSRVEFRQTHDDGTWNLRPDERFDLILIDEEHDAQSVENDITTALKVLAPGGLLAFHDYPDPRWSDMRKVVDEYAQRHGWKRIAQADYMGLFQT